MDGKLDLSLSSVSIMKRRIGEQLERSKWLQCTLSRDNITTRDKISFFSEGVGMKNILLFLCIKH